MSAYQPVLDPACGGRMFWFDKSDNRVLLVMCVMRAGNCAMGVGSMSSRTC